ncbi:uncharacterized protein BKCO1_1250005 [Diplodia corticola]|uniref:Uncharacterized protein n=1 Tax=Diplodia corticola TaxID=236234 RepID=A0A1J9RL42_9PEZI|nr:uncharacterized protein BKCO1_1250005 [Diplodia corticola]OJD28644.1 hypothetical protein BKCO1_1250005 [Diplodia corticola]
MAQVPRFSADQVEEANTRFSTIFKEHQSLDKGQKKKSEHKHVPPRTQLDRWQRSLTLQARGQQDLFDGAGERHWARRNLGLNPNGRVVWKPTRGEELRTARRGTKKVVPHMQIVCMEEWGARLLDAHVAASGAHRGRDSTYNWARDPERGVRDPANESRPSDRFVKPPMKEVIMDFIKHCPECSSRGAAHTTTTAAPAVVPDAPLAAPLVPAPAPAAAAIPAAAIPAPAAATAPLASSSSSSFCFPSPSSSSFFFPPSAPAAAAAGQPAGFVQFQDEASAIPDRDFLAWNQARTQDLFLLPAFDNIEGRYTAEDYFNLADDAFFLNEGWE